MKRRAFLLSAAAGLVPAGMALGASFTDQIVAQLRAQGYRQIKVARTLLGRVRITAISSRHRREIIFNPRSGEILRDYWESLGDSDDHGDMLINPEHDGGADGGSGDDGHDDGDDGGGDGGGDDGSDDGEDDREDDPSDDNETEDRETEHESEDEDHGDDHEDDTEDD
ncbi:PepSY domain-containing protein [Frigidibacter sp. ROC022]|uniref:PepSY domain-containing protein n=1 Tax=Frigidibacter sp. ROC022 TaxID=2971796 RepID=UPI00215A3EEE|nr:PepSY domain-containing protein [Frigidibacter sp. ROC022]MCR8722837.1 PepSY domain-containing protein [Frigidibacter sp. ROC022]